MNAFGSKDLQAYRIEQISQLKSDTARKEELGWRWVSNWKRRVGIPKQLK